MTAEVLGIYIPKYHFSVPRYVNQKTDFQNDKRREPI